MATEAEKKPEGEAAPAESPAPVIIIKKVMDDGHGGAHGGAWKIALADMMTAMMAFFLLMWLLGASTDDQRKSIADYFKPTSQSLIAIGQLAGSNGILGGRSIIDPDGFPFSAKQTGLLERLTPRSEGGPNPDTEPGPENENENADPDKLTPEQKKKIAAEADQANFDKLEKELKQKLSETKKLENLKEQVSITREKDGPQWPGVHAGQGPGLDQRGGGLLGRYAQQDCHSRPHRCRALSKCRGAQQLVAVGRTGRGHAQDAGEKWHQREPFLKDRRRGRYRPLQRQRPA